MLLKASDQGDERGARQRGQREGTRIGRRGWREENGWILVSTMTIARPTAAQGRARVLLPSAQGGVVLVVHDDVHGHRALPPSFRALRQVLVVAG